MMMHPWIRVGLVLITSSWMCASALAAQEVAPTNSFEPVLVSWESGDSVYYALDAGDSLNYSTIGPVSLKVELRRRLESFEGAVSSADILALGDGVQFMTLTSSNGAEPGGSIYDARGGIPSEADVATFDVPASGKRLTLKAPANGPDFLVRLIRTDDEPVGTAAVIPVEMDDGEAPLETEALAEEEAFGPSLEDTSEADDETVEADAAAARDAFWDENEDGPQVVTETEAKEMGIVTDADPGLESLGVGAVVGFGFPSHGSMGVPSIGLTARLPVVEDLLDISTTFGWYRIDVDEEFAVVDAYLGAIPMVSQWSTTVVPVTIDALLRTPMRLGIARIVLGGGMGVYLARRTEQETTVAGSALGIQAFLGTDLDLGPGVLTPRVGYQAARRDFGNTGSSAEAVRESLDTAQLGAAYFYEF